MPPSAADLVRRFYDRNAAAFSWFGQGGRTGTIRRAVWGPGVADRDQAFHFVDHQIAEHVREFAPSPIPRHVVDLGCGVGGSLCYLATRLPIRGTGITLSPVQARRTEARIRAAGLADRVRCMVGDYADLPASVGPADLVFAIESFVHGPNPARFFAQCGRLLQPGGQLILCDDFLRPTSDPAAPAVLERFRLGWHVNTLMSVEEVCTCARDAGFAHRSTLELSNRLELGRPRDRVIARFVALFGWLPLYRTRVGHLVGGDALQIALRRGWLGYDMVVFSRT